MNVLNFVYSLKKILLIHSIALPGLLLRQATKLCVDTHVIFFSLFSKHIENLFYQPPYFTLKQSSDDEHVMFHYEVSKHYFGIFILKQDKINHYMLQYSQLLATTLSFHIILFVFLNKLVHQIIHYVYDVCPKYPMIDLQLLSSGTWIYWL